MNEQNSGELEREAEQIRAGIAQTAEALQERMSPGKMIDEFMTYMKNSDGTLALDNLRRQARDNPMALAMIGSGFAWLAFGGGADRAPASDDATCRSSVGAGRLRRPTSLNCTSATDRDGGGLSGVASAVGDAASGFADRRAGSPNRTMEAAGHVADRVRGAAGDVSDGRARCGTMRPTAAMLLQTMCATWLIADAGR